MAVVTQKRPGEASVGGEPADKLSAAVAASISLLQQFKQTAVPESLPGLFERKKYAL